MDCYQALAAQLIGDAIGIGICVLYSSWKDRQRGREWLKRYRARVQADVDARLEE